MRRRDVLLALAGAGFAPAAIAWEPPTVCPNCGENFDLPPDPPIEPGWVRYHDVTRNWGPNGEAAQWCYTAPEHPELDFAAYGTVTLRRFCVEGK